jgi:hypothetical protein
VVIARRIGVGMLIGNALIATPIRGDAHPLHTTLTEVTVDSATHTVRVMVRVFADDFGTAVTRQAHLTAEPTGRAWSDAADRYVSAAVSITDRTNRPVALRSCGTRRSADLLWICLEGTTLESPHELRGRNSMLCDLFSDQVNIVQFVAGAQKHSVLFTKGDGVKRLWG